MSQTHQRALNLRRRHQLRFLPQDCLRNSALLGSHATNLVIINLNAGNTPTSTRRSTRWSIRSSLLNVLDSSVQRQGYRAEGCLNFSYASSKTKIPFLNIQKTAAA